MNSPYDLKELSIPHSIEAEQSVLGGLLIDNNAIDRLGELEESAFFTAHHKLIYSAIKKQAASGKSWDVITVAEELEANGKLGMIGGLAYIGSIAQGVPSSANIKRYADIVREHHTRRQIMAAAAELTEIVQNKGNIAEAMDKAQSSLLAITETVKTEEPRSITEIVQAHFNILESRLEGGVKGIPTGVDGLDELLNGGFHRGQVIVEGGRPSMGKTALSLCHSLHAARKGYGVLFLSMEMRDSELVDRALASLGRVNIGHILSGNMKEEEWSGISAATGKIQDIPLHILDKSNLSFYQVSTYARRHKRKHGLDLLVIDYLQLMSGSDPRAPRHAQIEEITRHLKSLAKELNIAIVLLSQLSRKTETSRRPKMSDLRDSGSVEQDADVILFIHTEQVDNPETDHKNYSDVYVGKNRQGALGRIGLTYIAPQIRFEKFTGQCPDWDAKQTGQSRGFK